VTRATIPADALAECRAAIRTGSHSFHAASRLLPARVRDPALALYAFCRIADDAVDEGSDRVAAVLALRDRLDRVYAGSPLNAAPDRAFAAVVQGYDMPRALPEALLEGFAWDAVGRRYDTLSGVLDYSARVAAAVGAMMCVLMGVRDRDALARACDLGLAMQLTNIARDVGEDARAGRLYLPLDWLDAAGIAPERFLADPRPTPEVRQLTARLLETAEVLYRRAMGGVPALPRSCRPGIAAAGRIYGAIGTVVAENGYDSVTVRASTSPARKLVLLARAGLDAAVTLVSPRPARLHAPPAAETAFLVDAAARRPPREARSDALLSVLAQLEAKDRARRDRMRRPVAAE
jgi:phytoene synthase